MPQTDIRPNEIILDRIATNCIVAARTNQAKQRLVRTAIELSEKEQPVHFITIILWIAFAFLFICGVWLMIMNGLANG